ncbi:hypothetical protein [Dactylosporangium sp. NPDC000521]|uniref:hypothetical protein n=1 Tax=Dactylosporangium sp. NPDC000521 TaxID=3363975 RepID=UPI0036CCE070
MRSTQLWRSQVLCTGSAIRATELHPLVSADTEPRPGASAGTRARGAVRDGFRYLATQPVVLVTFAVALVLGSLGRNYQVTMPAMSDGPLAAGPAGYGALSTVFAAGTVAGALLAGRRAPPRRRRRRPHLHGRGAVQLRGRARQPFGGRRRGASRVTSRSGAAPGGRPSPR